MINNLRLLFNFSQTAPTNTFRIRSRLAQFFKHTHPDVLQNAPQRIKEQNSRSLKNLNAYIDSVSQSKAIEAKLLRFYIAQKSNNKSKKYYSFEVQLPEVKTGSTQEQSSNIMNNIVDILNGKFVESRGMRNPNVKPKEQVEMPTETDEQRWERIQHELKPMNEKQVKWLLLQNVKKQMFLERVYGKMNQVYLMTERQTLLNRLKDKVHLANTPRNKPMMWSRLAMKQAGVYLDYQKVLENLIDPKLIYFSQDLSEQQIQEFKRRLLPGNLQLKQEMERQALTKVFYDMEDTEPPILLFVTKAYSATDIPGFLSVPYNFTPKLLTQTYGKLKQKILEQRKIYEYHYDSYRELTKMLEKQNNLLVQFQNFKNNNDISRKILCLKRLQRHKATKKTRVLPMLDEYYEIYCKECSKDPNKSCHEDNGKIIMKVDFLDQDLSQYIE